AAAPSLAARLRGAAAVASRTRSATGPWPALRRDPRRVGAVPLRRLPRPRQGRRLPRRAGALPRRLRGAAAARRDAAPPGRRGALRAGPPAERPRRAAAEAARRPRGQRAVSRRRPRPGVLVGAAARAEPAGEPRLDGGDARRAAAPGPGGLVAVRRSRRRL